MRDIGNVDQHFRKPVITFPNGNRVIVVLGVFRIDGEREGRSEIGTAFELLVGDFSRRLIGLLERRFRKRRPQLEVLDDRLELGLDRARWSEDPHDAGIDVGMAFGIEYFDGHFVPVLGATRMAGEDVELTE